MNRTPQPEQQRCAAWSGAARPPNQRGALADRFL